MIAGAALASAAARDPADLLLDLREDLAHAAEIGERLRRADSDIARDEMAGSLATVQANILRDLDAALGALSPPARDKGAPPLRVDASARRALIVAANATSRRVLTGLARADGFEAFCVETVAAAAERLEAGPIETIVVDLDAPDLDAFAALARIGAAAVAPARLIGVGEPADPGARERLRAEGFDALIATPVDPDMFAALLAGAGDETGESRPPEKAPTFDITALRDLETLGGEAFARDIAAQFLADAVGLLGAIRAAAEACDEAAFRDQTHALRSCAANVGARSIYEKCLTWRALDAAELARQGAECAETLERDYALVAERIGAYARDEAPLGD
jgi:two-component system sensor histidine kinase RpfC